MSNSTTSRLCAGLGALVLALAVTGCSSTGAVPKPFPLPGAAPRPATPSPPPAVPATAAPPVTSRPLVQAPAPYGQPPLVLAALSLLGAPYRSGGATPTGFDCSGFTQYVFGQHGVWLPRDVGAQYALGRSVNKEDVVPGDLVFFSTTARGASHVGIAVGREQFVHAPSSDGVVRVESRTAAYWAKRFIGARRMS